MDETGDIPEATSPDNNAGLWDRAHDWLWRWLAVFQPDEIARDGLSRRFYLRCCKWLSGIEATVRRLIISAALAFDCTSLPPRKTATPRQQKPAGKKQTRAPFRIVSLRGAGAPGKARHATPAAGARHLPYPSDPLLRLGFAPPQAARRAGLRQPHPLIRCGRIWHYDPDFIPREEADYANTSPLLFGDPARESGKPRRDPHAAGRDAGRAIRHGVEDSEWRRVEQEWERILPAPGIASRIAALVHAFEQPRQYIARLARRLRGNPLLADLLREQPAPALRKPKYDRLGPQVDEDLPLLAHAAIPPCDTS